MQVQASRRRRRRLTEARLNAARLWSGLILMVFLVFHLLNLALGLVSLEAAEAVRPFFSMVWRNPVGTVALYGAVLIHAALTLRTLYLRRTLVMPAREAAQTLLGLAIPLLIALHVFGTRVFSALSGVNDTYAYVVRVLWVISPQIGLLQVFALVATWIHGCLGVHFWLRYRSWYPAAGPLLYAGALLVPVLALLAFVALGREQALQPGTPFADPERVAAAARQVYAYLDWLYIGFSAVVAGVLAARWLRQQAEWRDLVEVRYESGEVVRVPRGHSVLEASRVGGIPHYSVCGGRGRCSTCRVEILSGRDRLPEPDGVERTTLSRLKASPDIRLACQLRPTHGVTVRLLLTGDVANAAATAGLSGSAGRERDIVVLFCDIRGFTALADQRLPYDVVFLLNRYFGVVGAAVERAGGRLDKFIGDGAMALFGLDVGRAAASRQALAAASAILRDLERLSGELAGELGNPLRVAIGIHAGPAIVGEMGYGGVMNVTAIGDTVNVASRLEAAAKEFDAALVISEVAASASAIDLSGFGSRRIAIRGSAEPLEVRIVPHGAPLAIGAEAQGDLSDAAGAGRRSTIGLS